MPPVLLMRYNIEIFVHRRSAQSTNPCQLRYVHCSRYQSRIAFYPGHSMKVISYFIFVESFCKIVSLILEHFRSIFASIVQCIKHCLKSILINKIVQRCFRVA